ncbi:MAG TPA: PorP/SprF family type IX secretion system membrane protein [Bacteroidales bacterium]|nr:PorP/SprF family type IX secretion system membrane protein [Bacteroidales bacterium]
MLRNIIFTFCVLFSGFYSEAQDIHFSQLAQTPLLINPSSTGLYDGFYRANLNYKNQWTAMGKPYRTFMGSFDMPVIIRTRQNTANLGIGAFLFYDNAGESNYSTTQFNVCFSGIVPTGEFHKLSVGIGAGIVYNSFDISDIQWPNQYNGQSYDPALPSNETGFSKSLFSFDLAAGVQYHMMKQLRAVKEKEIVCFNLGAAIFHVTKPVQHYSGWYRERVYPRIVFHSSFRYDFRNTGVGIVPALLYMWQGPSKEFDAEILVRFRTGKKTNYTGFFTESAVFAGLHYRHKDALSPMVLFEISDFGLGISYDINISSFSRATKMKGGLEISVYYAKMKGLHYKNH